MADAENPETPAPAPTPDADRVGDDVGDGVGAGVGDGDAATPAPRPTSSLLTPAPRRGPTPGQVLRTVGVVVLSLVLLAGLAAAATGVWLVRELGSSGSATFTADPGRTVLVAGPDVLARNQTPVTVRVEAADADTVLQARLASPGDATSALGEARATVVTGVDVDGWRVLTRTAGDADATGITSGDVWTSETEGDGSVEVTVSRSSGAQTLVVTGEDGGPVDLDRVTMTWSNGAWFVQSVALLVAGVVVAVAAAVALGRRVRKALRSRKGSDGGPGGAPDPAPDATDGDDADEPDVADVPGPRRQGNSDDTVVLRLDGAADTTDTTADTDTDTPAPDPTQARP